VSGFTPCCESPADTLQPCLQRTRSAHPRRRSSRFEGCCSAESITTFMLFTASAKCIMRGRCYSELLNVMLSSPQRDVSCVNGSTLTPLYRKPDRIASLIGSVLVRSISTGRIDTEPITTRPSQSSSLAVKACMCGTWMARNTTTSWLLIQP
jgi:hypothetical protein